MLCGRGGEGAVFPVQSFAVQHIVFALAKIIKVNYSGLLSNIYLLWHLYYGVINY